jgi:hypothetical protein
MDINIVNSFIRFQTIVKYYHWATSSYDAHKITDTMHADLALFIDNFVEAYSGSTKSQVPRGESVECKFTIPTSNESFLKSCEVFSDFLVRLKVRKDMTPQLVNMIDELLATLDKYAFLLRLK